MANILARLDSRIPCLGILFIMVASFFATGGKLFVKQINLDLHPVVIVMVRCGMLSVVWLFVVAVRRDFIFGQNKQELKLLFLRGILGFAAFMLNYLALSFISLADCTTIVLSSPIYTTVFGYFLLKGKSLPLRGQLKPERFNGELILVQFTEKCGPINIGLICVTLAGVVLIARPSFLFAGGMDADEEWESAKLVGTVMAFLSSVITALANIIMRKLKQVPAPVVVTWFSISSFLFSLVGILLAKLFCTETVTIRVIDFESEFLFLVANALCGVFAQLFITLSLKVEEASTISLARSVDILLSFVFQALFLKHEPIYWTSICGALIIAVGVTLSALNKLREKRSQANTGQCAAGGPDSFLSSDPNNDLEKERKVEDASETMKNGQFLTVVTTKKQLNR